MSGASKGIIKGDTATALAKMNVKHAVVKEGGRTVVLTERWDPAMKRRCIDRSSFADTRAFYQNRLVKVSKSKLIGLGDWWLKHPQRRQYEGVCFVPRDEGIPDYFNLWRGFPVEPEAGSWTRYMQHMTEVICGSDFELWLYLLAWMAAGVQHPDIKPEVAIVLRSPERGTGKSMFTKYYRQLFGQHGLEISNPTHLTGKFNAHLEDCCVLVVNEAFCAGSPSTEAVLKTLITEDTIAIERKGMDLRFAKSYLRVMMTSNAEWVVPAGLDERRFLVLDVSPMRKQDTAYFAKIVEEMDNGGLAAMLDFLLAFDYSNIDLRRPPQTAALIEQKLQSLDPRQRWLFDKLHEGRLLPGDDGWRSEISKSELHNSYREELGKSGIGEARTQTELGKFLHKMLAPKLTETRKGQGGARVRSWQFPPLPECRELFDQKLGTAYDWPPADLVAVEPPTESASDQSRLFRPSRA